jgi:hypothetical protein
MGLSIFIMAISGYTAFMASMPLPLLAKRPIANESEGRNRESWGVGGRPTDPTLHFPYLNLLSCSIIKLHLILHFPLMFSFFFVLLDFSNLHCFTRFIDLH